MGDIGMLLSEFERESLKLEPLGERGDLGDLGALRPLDEMEVMSVDALVRVDERLLIDWERFVLDEPKPSEPLYPPRVDEVLPPQRLRAIPSLPNTRDARLLIIEPGVPPPNELALVWLALTLKRPPALIASITFLLISPREEAVR
jgi:hypothetical protein